MDDYVLRTVMTLTCKLDVLVGNAIAFLSFHHCTRPRLREHLASKFSSNTHTHTLTPVCTTLFRLKELQRLRSNIDQTVTKTEHFLSGCHPRAAYGCLRHHTTSTQPTRSLRCPVMHHKSCTTHTYTHTHPHLIRKGYNNTTLLVLRADGFAPF